MSETAGNPHQRRALFEEFRDNPDPDRFGPDLRTVRAHRNRDHGAGDTLRRTVMHCVRHLSPSLLKSRHMHGTTQE